MHQITTVFHQPKKIMLFGTNFPEQRKLVVAAAIYSNFNSNLLVQRDAWHWTNFLWYFAGRCAANMIHVSQICLTYCKYKWRIANTIDVSQIWLRYCIYDLCIVNTIDLLPKWVMCREHDSRIDLRIANMIDVLQIWFWYRKYDWLIAKMIGVSRIWFTNCFTYRKYDRRIANMIHVP